MLHARVPGTMPVDQDFPVSIEFTTAHCINSTSPTFDDEQWVQPEVLVLGADRLVHLINGKVVLEYERPTISGA